MKRFYVALLSLFFTLPWTRPSFGYPNFISYGYQSCMSCHYNPYGNGPLTDYGRAVATSEISSRYFVDEKVTDEELAKRSSFLGHPNPIEWLRPSLNYRGLSLTSNLSGTERSTRFVNMDLSMSLVAKLLSSDSLILVGQIAYAPTPIALAGSQNIKNYRSREFYAGYRITKNFGVYGGLMDKVFGIRIPDHIAYSRTLTGLNQNDQTHGILFHFVNKSLELGIQPFIGNLVQNITLRQKGVTTQVEFTAADTTRLGMSYLKSESEFTAVQMAATHLRTGVGHANSILAEFGRVNRQLKTQQTTEVNDYAMTQSQLRITRGAWAILTLEGKKSTSDPNHVATRIAPGIQIFPRQNIEVRADAYITPNSTANNTPPQCDLAAQLHLWF